MQNKGETLRYVAGRAETQVYFPAKRVCCAMCRFCIKDGYSYLRQICMLTGEIVPEPELGRMYGCPLKIEEV